MNPQKRFELVYVVSPANLRAGLLQQIYFVFLQLRRRVARRFEFHEPDIAVFNEDPIRDAAVRGRRELPCVPAVRSGNIAATLFDFLLNAHYVLRMAFSITSSHVS